MGKLIYLAGLLSICLVSGCQRTAFDEKSVDHQQKEYLLSKVNNYQGLISLYREKLIKKDNHDTRYKLAELYYQVADYESSRHYLQPLLDNKKDEKAWLLESKNLLETGRMNEALAAIERVQALAPESGEAWNLRGVLLAQAGDYQQAEQAFSQARLRFVDDKIVLNNLAMLAIMQENYMAARDYLMPLYARGDSSQKMLHNLVFVLVKLQDFQGAEAILSQEKMVEDRDGLLESLATIKPRPQQQLVSRSARIQAAPASATASLAKVAPAPTPAVAKAAPASPKAAPVLTTASLAQAAPAPRKEVSVPAAMTGDNGAAPVKAAGMISPPPESASLAVTGNLREIEVIRTGQHATYFRITLESSHAINYREVNATGHNQRVFELYNVKIDAKMLDTARHIPGRHPDIQKISFYQKDVNTMLMTVDFSREVNRAKVFRLAKNKKVQERLIFDIFYG